MTFVALGSSQRIFDGRKVPINANAYELSWYSKTSFFTATRLISHMVVLIDNFASLEQVSKTFAWETFLPLKILVTKKLRNFKIFCFLSRVKPSVLQNYCLDFIRQGMNMNRLFWIHMKLIECQTIDIILWNRNLMGQTSQIVNMGLIRFDSYKQQLPRFFLSRSQSTILLPYKMFQCPYPLFHPFLENLITVNCQKFCLCMMLLFSRTNFVIC